MIALLLLLALADVELRSTGAAIRSKLGVTIYQIESFADAGVSFANAEVLAKTDCAKRMKMTMLRAVTGRQAADSFLEIFRANNGDKFSAEAKALADWMRANPTRRGDVVLLEHVAGKSLKVTGPSSSIEISSTDFAAAVWRNWLGKSNVGEDVKAGLTRNLSGRPR